MGPGGGKALPGSLTHPSAGVLCKQQKEFVCPKSETFLPRIGNMCLLGTGAPRGSLDGRVPPMPCSLPAGNETDAPHSLAAAGHNWLQ